jgi:hypothetical protein
MFEMALTTLWERRCDRDQPIHLYIQELGEAAKFDSSVSFESRPRLATTVDCVTQTLKHTTTEGAKLTTSEVKMHSGNGSQ